ncbi:MAG: hypothetical protein COB93_05400, partial [Sneathiella sp.]
MTVEIRVPVLGESVTEATVGQWFKKVGDAVTKDEPIVELETDKVTLEINASESGRLEEILVAEGEDVEVGALLGQLAAGAAGTTAPAVAAPAKEVKTAPAAPAAAPAAASTPVVAASADVLVLPAAQKLMDENNLSAASIRGTGKDGRITKGDVLEARMRRQTELAIEDADVCLLLIDARLGVVPHDKYFATLLRKSATPIILAANKCEGGAGQSGLHEAYKLGLGEPIPLSAEHGLGLDELYDALEPFAVGIEEDELNQAIDDEIREGEEGFDPDAPYEPDLEAPLRIAVVGRPNAGKSTMINQLLGEDRMLTGPEAGITRDSIGVEWEWRGRRVKLFDTAGLRRRARVTEKLE